MAAELDLSTLLAGMQPVVRSGEYVFVSVPAATPIGSLPSLATVVEDEGTTHVVERAVADERGLAYDFVAAWITLQVHSALAAVGLTAAVAGALADAGISCNVLAGAYHDHLLVPHERAADAVRVLEELSVER
jgi:hypothetical protein